MWIALIAILIYSVAGYWVVSNFEIPPIRGMAWLFILLGGICQMAGMWFFGLLFKESIQEVGGNITSWQGFKAGLVGAGVARLIPVGGAITPVAMAWTVRDETSEGTGPALRAVLFNYAGLLIMAGVGVLVARPTGSAQVFGIGLIVLAPIVLLAGVMLMFGSGRLQSLNKYLPKFVRDRLASSVIDHPPTLQTQFYLWSRLILEVAAMWFVFHAFQIDLGPFQAMAVFAASALFGGLPGTPGGLGITEFGLALMLGAYGFRAADAAVAILIYRVISYWLPAATGFLAGGTTFLRSDEAKEAEASG